MIPVPGRPGGGNLFFHLIVIIDCDYVAGWVVFRYNRHRLSMNLIVPLFSGVGAWDVTTLLTLMFSYYAVALFSIFWLQDSESQACGVAMVRSQQK
jgi:hypothetical protein